MKLLILLILTSGCFAGQPDGSYNFKYDTSEQREGRQFRDESRAPDGSVVGKYGYEDPSGVIRVVHYTAGKEGYVASGDGIEAPVGEAYPQSGQVYPQQGQVYPQSQPQAIPYGVSIQGIPDSQPIVPEDESSSAYYQPQSQPQPIIPIQGSAPVIGSQPGQPIVWGGISPYSLHYFGGVAPPVEQQKEKPEQQQQEEQQQEQQQQQEQHEQPPEEETKKPSTTTTPSPSTGTPPAPGGVKGGGKKGGSGWVQRDQHFPHVLTGQRRLVEQPVQKKKKPFRVVPFAFKKQPHAWAQSSKFGQQQYFEYPFQGYQVQPQQPKVYVGQSVPYPVQQPKVQYQSYVIPVTYDHQGFQQYQPQYQSYPVQPQGIVPSVPVQQAQVVRKEQVPIKKIQYKYVQVPQQPVVQQPVVQQPYYQHYQYQPFVQYKVQPQYVVIPHEKQQVHQVQYQYQPVEVVYQSGAQVIKEIPVNQFTPIGQQHVPKSGWQQYQYGQYQYQQPVVQPYSQVEQVGHIGGQVDGQIIPSFYAIGGEPIKPSVPGEIVESVKPVGVEVSSGQIVGQQIPIIKPVGVIEVHGEQQVGVKPVHQVEGHSVVIQHDSQPQEAAPQDGKPLFYSHRQEGAKSVSV